MLLSEACLQIQTAIMHMSAAEHWHATLAVLKHLDDLLLCMVV